MIPRSSFLNSIDSILELLSKYLHYLRELTIRASRDLSLRGFALPEICDSRLQRSIFEEMDCPIPQERWIKKHASGCVSYRDEENKIQMWRPEFTRSRAHTHVKSEIRGEKGHIYILTSATYRHSSIYKLGFTAATERIVLAEHSAVLTNPVSIAFVESTAKDYERLEIALLPYKVPGYAKYTITVIIPLGNLFQTMRETLKISIGGKEEIVPPAPVEEMPRHVIVFMKIYLSQPRTGAKSEIRREMEANEMYMEFLSSHLKPLCLFASRQSFDSALARIGYTVADNRVTLARDLVQDNIKQLTLGKV